MHQNASERIRTHQKADECVSKRDVATQLIVRLKTIYQRLDGHIQFYYYDDAAE